MTKPLEGRIALVAGATRGAGRGIARALGQAGATVYGTGRSSRDRTPTDPRRPETIEDTADLVTAAGGEGAAVVALVDRLRRERGRLDIVVNDIWGGDALTEWGRPFWELDCYANAIDLEAHPITALALTPGFLRSEHVLDHFGVTEETWEEAIAQDPHFAHSETPMMIGRVIAALAADPNLSRLAGRALTTWDLARHYRVRDIDGRQPHWDEHLDEAVEGILAKESPTEDELMLLRLRMHQIDFDPARREQRRRMAARLTL